MQDEKLTVRSLTGNDRPAWEMLWDEYNSFYGRAGPTALPAIATEATWNSLLDGSGAIQALVADLGGVTVGLAHYLFHASTIEPRGVCYVQDLIVASGSRRRGVARRLVAAVAASARDAGVGRVYWHTHATNETAIRLYDRLARRTDFLMYTMPARAGEPGERVGD